MEESKENENLESKTFLELFWVPEVYTCMPNKLAYRKYKLSILQRIFMTLEVPLSW
jgi:hypothetical protein